MVRILLLISFLVFTLEANVAKVIAIKGEAFSILDDKKSILKINSTIDQKDTIRTSKNAKLQLLFLDNTIITIGRNANFKVEEYEFNEKEKKHTAKFSLLKGTFRTITGKIGKIAPNRFTLKSKTSSIGIRGTQIVLSIEEDREQIFCTEGEISVTSLKDGSETVLQAGEVLKVKTDSSEPAVKEKFDKKELKQVDEESKFSAKEETITTEITATTQAIPEAVIETITKEDSPAKEETVTITKVDLATIDTSNIEAAEIEFDVEEATTTTTTTTSTDTRSPGFISVYGKSFEKIVDNGASHVVSGVTLNYTFVDLDKKFATANATGVVSTTLGNGTYTKVTNTSNVTGASFDSDIGWGSWTLTASIPGQGTVSQQGNWVYGNLTSKDQLLELAKIDTAVSYSGNLLINGDSSGTISMGINFSSGAITSNLTIGEVSTEINGTDTDVINGYNITDGDNKLSGNFYGQNAQVTSGAFSAGGNTGVFQADKNNNN